VDRLRKVLRILDRLEEAVRTGNTRHVVELAGLEDSVTREEAAVERAVQTLTRAAAVGKAAASRRDVQRLLLEHDALRSLVLQRKRDARELIAKELLSTRRELASRRARLGTPSPYAAIGEARLLDIRT
jgi:hypothetical protein